MTVNPETVHFQISASVTSSPSLPSALYKIKIPWLPHHHRLLCRLLSLRGDLPGIFIVYRVPRRSRCRMLAHPYRLILPIVVPLWMANGSGHTM
jgi:hypothetical protein